MAELKSRISKAMKRLRELEKEYDALYAAVMETPEERGSADIAQRIEQKKWANKIVKTYVPILKKHVDAGNCFHIQRGQTDNINSAWRKLTPADKEWVVEQLDVAHDLGVFGREVTKPWMRMDIHEWLVENGYMDWEQIGL